MPRLANTPKRHIIRLSSPLFVGHDDGYGEEVNKMVALAGQQTGFLGIESAREDVGIIVSYWSDLDAIKK
ncbi:MAG: heme-degrading monooxygenase HmoA [Candidatus Endobugula sp.]|jgi:heme-degrading monooxygenase HmoA